MSSQGERVGGFPEASQMLVLETGSVHGIEERGEGVAEVGVLIDNNTFRFVQELRQRLGELLIHDHQLETILDRLEDAMRSHGEAGLDQESFSKAHLLCQVLKEMGIGYSSYFRIEGAFHPMGRRERTLVSIPSLNVMVIVSDGRDDLTFVVRDSGNWNKYVSMGKDELLADSKVSSFPCDSQEEWLRSLSEHLGLPKT